MLTFSNLHLYVVSREAEFSVFLGQAPEATDMPIVSDSQGFFNFSLEHTTEWVVLLRRKRWMGDQSAPSYSSPATWKRGKEITVVVRSRLFIRFRSYFRSNQLFKQQREDECKCFPIQESLEGWWKIHECLRSFDVYFSRWMSLVHDGMGSTELDIAFTRVVSLPSFEIPGM